MCSPVALTVASTLGGTASQFYNYQQQTRSAQASADYNSQIAADQARTAQALAQNELAKGEADRTRFLRNATREQGDLRSLLGGSGFEMDTGSSLALLGESAQEWQYDANIGSQNAAMAAWQHKANANAALNEQGFYNYQMNNSRGSALAQGLGMTGSLLGGLGQAMPQYNNLYKNPGSAAKSAAGLGTWWK